MKYKLLVLDLDGTLTNSQKEITPFTKEVLIKRKFDIIKRYLLKY